MRGHIHIWNSFRLFRLLLYFWGVGGGSEVQHESEKVRFQKMDKTGFGVLVSIWIPDDPSPAPHLNDSSTTSSSPLPSALASAMIHTLSLS